MAFSSDSRSWTVLKIFSDFSACITKKASSPGVVLGRIQYVIGALGVLGLTFPNLSFFFH